MQILRPKWFTPDLQRPKTAASQNILVLCVCFAIQVAGKALTESQAYTPYWSLRHTAPSVPHLSKP